VAEDTRQRYTRIVHGAIRDLIINNETPVEEAKQDVRQSIDRLRKDWYTQDEIEMKREAVDTFTS